MASPRAGIAAACGAATGMVFHTFAAALGVAALFAQAPAAYDAVRVGGGLYLVWLPSDTSGPRHTTRPLIRTIKRAGHAVYSCAPGWTTSPIQGDPVLPGIPAVALGVFSGRIGEWLRRGASVGRAIDWLAGTIMGALGVRRLVSGRHT
jgi:threonine/homoserine/homoserine lactone efflux protein